MIRRVSEPQRVAQVLEESFLDQRVHPVLAFERESHVAFGPIESRVERFSRHVALSSRVPAAGPDPRLIGEFHGRTLVERLCTLRLDRTIARVGHIDRSRLSER